MNENKLNGNKKPIYWYIFSGFIIILFLTFFWGYYLGRGRISVKIADAQATIDELTDTIGDLNETIKRASIENQKLRGLLETDGKRITELEGFNNQLSNSNNRITEIIGKQRQLINEITSGNIKFGESSGEITEGLGEAITTIDRIIQDIQSGEN